jgi:enoyl-CoA hydratase
VGQEVVLASLLIERHGPVGWLIFNRPASGNAMDAQMMAALPEAWRRLETDSEVRVIVVTGQGRSFQTGLDLVQLSSDPAALRDMSRRTRRADLQLTGRDLDVSKPILTAVNGTCAGGGLHFVADSDVVIAATTATFLDPHVTIGQVSAFEAIGMIRRAGFGDVARMAFTGGHERISAWRALELGWISQVVDPPDGLRAAAQQLAERIADNDPTHLAIVKRLLWHALESEGRARIAAHDGAPLSQAAPNGGAPLSRAAQDEATR